MYISLLRKHWTRSSISKALRLLTDRERRLVYIVVLLQIALGFLDLLGVAIIGLLGALAVSGVQSQQPGLRVFHFTNLIGIENYTLQIQATILGSVLILVLRTIISIFILRKTMFFLSRRAAMVSRSMVSKLLGSSLLQIQRQTNQETIYAIGHGVSSITLGILGTSISIIADSSLLLIMSLGLFYIDPTIALVSFIFFSMVGLILYRLMHSRAKELGRLNWELSLLSDETIAESLNSFKELAASNRREYYVRQISEARFRLADVLAEMQFMPNVSKYVIESSVIFGAFLISGLQFILQDAKHAVATLAVFLASGTRIAPAALRIQQGSVLVRNSLGSAIPAFKLYEDLLGAPELDRVSDIPDFVHKNFTGRVVIDGLEFSYPGQSTMTISGVSLTINEGDFVAIIGPSGAGKTTLVDLILGVLNPSSGEIRISGDSPEIASSRWPGAVSYVPQNVAISNRSIRENVALGFPLEFVQDEEILEAINLAQLSDFVQALPNGLDTHVGEAGAKLSGGQRQRLGIARALFTNPKLVVLDEATSSLDTATETDVSNAIQNLKGKTTVIAIAHRLSTIRNADLIVYLESGKIAASGNFEDIRNVIPGFDIPSLEAKPEE